MLQVHDATSEPTNLIRQIHELSKPQFAAALGSVASHSKPIDKISHLKGRETQINTVEEAIYTPGRHVFIYGERGVGKTSLAKTAGRAVVDATYFKQFGCGSDTTFGSLMRQVIEAFAPKKLASIQKGSSFGLSKLLSVNASKNETYGAQDVITVSWAADVLASLDDDGKNTIRVVVIDEMERLTSPDARRDFAELVKLLGDRGALITFIFTGVGADLEAILGSHPSSFRQFAQVKLERIVFQPSLDIIDDAFARFDIDANQEPMLTARYRIAGIANGFPVYVHLLIEKLLYALYYDRSATEITLDHLRQAIEAAVVDAQEEIRKSYDLATRGRSDIYRLATWATADSWDLERTTTQIYQSYCALCERVDAASIQQKNLSQVLATLKRPTHGPILSKGFRHGQYQFSENIVRGYVRLCAAAAGIELQDLSPRSDTPITHAHARQTRAVHPDRTGGPPTTLRR